MAILQDVALGHQEAITHTTLQHSFHAKEGCTMAKLRGEMMSISVGHP